MNVRRSQGAADEPISWSGHRRNGTHMTSHGALHLLDQLDLARLRLVPDGAARAALDPGGSLCCGGAGALLQRLTEVS